MIDKQTLKKYFAGDATRQEKEDIQLWLEESDKNKEEYSTLRKLYDIALINTFEEEPVRYSVSNIIRNFLKIASIVLITFGCTYYFSSTKKANDEVKNEIVAMQSIYVPAGQRVELNLTDGTKVWVNALTTISFPEKFSEQTRDVYLDGEAFFDVNRNMEKKFIVHTHKYNINVLGTEFNVSSYKSRDNFEAYLLSGSLEVVSNDNISNVTLEPGGRVYYKDGLLVKGDILHYDYFLWKNGIISFEHERIEDILLKLQQYYDTNIYNKNKSINDMRYTGKFQTKDGIEHVLNVLKIPTGLRFTKDRESNTINIY
jgi:Fe2+-dicitrate sensor, membrane component